MSEEPKNMSAFIKEAFCIDGDTVAMSRLSKVITEDGSFDGLTIRCFDKRRGVFFVTISQENK
jgi:hypothetical protein|tara:strand:- start:224 stop:412 length:189 start_codon:yes stop_codon:yes gene_type:complete